MQTAERWARGRPHNPFRPDSLWSSDSCLPGPGRAGGACTLSSGCSSGSQQTCCPRHRMRSYRGASAPGVLVARTGQGALPQLVLARQPCFSMCAGGGSPCDLCDVHTPSPSSHGADSVPSTEQGRLLSGVSVQEELAPPSGRAHAAPAGCLLFLHPVGLGWPLPLRNMQPGIHTSRRHISGSSLA